ncbi:signal transduction histidine kinase [Flavobacterium arsenatis]|uniref:Signal transduction histidine kinase n=1 Tax=Flavobacterium arsenatis TaxID=1484332 RepID=A0ABU1TLG4_9FLAO|nr:histidine kinase [Flavobacterium arsenatis]MDR6966701.1 signal transduction histidine kinase [Flavobacterium arsenatis]
MKNSILLIVFFLSGIIFSNAQEKQRYKELSKETLSYSSQAKDCWQNSDESCIPFYKKMVASAKKNKECVPCAEIELVKGYYNEYEVDSAIHHIKNVLKDAKSQKEHIKWELEQDGYGMLSHSYYLKGDTQKAIKYLLESSKYADKLGNKEQAAIIKANLGNYYNNMQNYKEGIRFQKTAIKDLKALGISKNTAVFAGNIAGAYIDSNQPDSALVWGKRTIKMALEQKDANSLTAGYYLTGAAFEKTNIDSAFYYVNKSLPWAKSTNNLLSMATAHNILGNVYSQKSEYQEAKKNFMLSIDLYKKIGKPIGLYAPLKTLGLEANRFKDYEIASKYMSEYIEYQDSVVSEDNRKLVHELNTKYGAEKKQKLLAEQKLIIEKEQNQKRLILIVGIVSVLTVLSILVLYRKNQKIKQEKTIREKENEVLTAFINGEERERSRISQELHDGVASMIGVAKMNMETLPHLSEEKQKHQIQKVVQILENTHSDIRHIAHNLLPITLEKEGLVKATEQFANEINETGILKITITNQTDGTLNLSTQKQLMLFRMIQELVNNSIKHSQAQKATIVFRQNQHNLLIEISDDGIGFDGGVTRENQGLYSIHQRMSSILGRFSFEQGENNRGVRSILELNTSK